jgi:hypothetical protein
MGRVLFSAGDHVDRPEGEPRLLTPTQLSTHLACAHYTQLERKRRAGELQVEFMPDPRLEAMRSRGAQHERAYIDRLRQADSSIVDLRERKDPRATLAAMREGAQAIVQAPLGNDDFAGIADVLLRVEVPSALATVLRAGGYEARPRNPGGHDPPALHLLRDARRMQARSRFASMSSRR